MFARRAIARLVQRLRTAARALTGQSAGGATPVPHVLSLWGAGLQSMRQSLGRSHVIVCGCDTLPELPPNTGVKAVALTRKQHFWLWEIWLENREIFKCVVRDAIFFLFLMLVAAGGRLLVEQIGVAACVDADGNQSSF